MGPLGERKPFIYRFFNPGSHEQRVIGAGRAGLCGILTKVKAFDDKANSLL
jgi:hypothetical protein